MASRRPAGEESLLAAAATACSSAAASADLRTCVQCLFAVALSCCHVESRIICGAGDSTQLAAQAAGGYFLLQPRVSFCRRSAEAEWLGSDVESRRSKVFVVPPVHCTVSGALFAAYELAPSTTALCSSDSWASSISFLAWILLKSSAAADLANTSAS